MLGFWIAAASAVSATTRRQGENGLSATYGRANESFAGTGAPLTSADQDQQTRTSKRAQSNNVGRRFLHLRVSKLWRRWLHRQALIRVFVLPHRPTLSPSGMRKLRANPAPKGLDFLRRLSVAGVLGDAEAGRDRIRKIDARGQLRLGEHTKAR